MADVSLTAAFSTVPAGEAEEIKRVITEVVAQIAQDDGTFKRAKIVFTESDERCGLTAELDGIKKEGVPLQIDIDQLEDAKTPPVIPRWEQVAADVVNTEMEKAMIGGASAEETAKAMQEKASAIGTE